MRYWNVCVLDIIPCISDNIKKILFMFTLNQQIFLIQIHLSQIQRILYLSAISAVQLVSQGAGMAHGHFDEVRRQ